MGWLRRILPVLVTLCATPALAGPVKAAVEKAALLVKSGVPDEALRLCQELRVEYPESHELLFAIGSAQAALAAQLQRTSDAEKSAAHWRRARDTFARVAPEGGLLGASAAYNAATCLVLLDGTFTQDAYDARVENLRGAVAALEAYIAHYPEAPRARKNLDYARYTLNVLLQNPPDNREPEDGEDDEASATSAVNAATTQIPGAEAEVVDGSVVVLRRPPAEETPP